MKKLLLTIALVSSLFSNEFTVEKDYSSIKFEASKFMFVGVSGEFSNFSGSITLDQNNKLSTINGLISVASIDSKDEERDEHLRADDYFFESKFPNIEFTSIEIDNNLLKAGVKIKGIEKELFFKISDLSVSSENVSFTLRSTVDRQEFMLNGSMSGVMADNVDVIAHIVATKK